MSRVVKTLHEIPAKPSFAEMFHKKMTYVIQGIIYKTALCLFNFFFIINGNGAIEVIIIMLNIQERS